MVKDKIAILGASGFIGKHLCKKLIFFGNTNLSFASLPQSTDRPPQCRTC